MARRHQRSRGGEEQLGTDRRAEIAKREADEQSEVSVVVDRAPMTACCKMLHQARYSTVEVVFREAARRRISAAELPPSERRASNRSIGPTSRSAARCFGESDDATNARRDQDAFPQPLVTRTERSAYFGVHFRDVDPRLIERAQRRRVSLFEQGDEQMFRTYVVMAMIAAFLLRYS